MHRLQFLSFNQRVAILIGLLILGLIVLLQIAPIPQDPDYHFFADTRSFFGIPNFSEICKRALLSHSLIIIKRISFEVRFFDWGAVPDQSTR